MPARNSRKQYSENSYYHIYNRGVEKRTIFQDIEDYEVFLSYLKEYLEPRDEERLLAILADESVSYKEKNKILRLLKLNNFFNRVSLICFCLMPNHFHFLVKQRDREAMDIFMNSIATRYTMFFNKKYKRVGPLYQGVYKAVLVKTDAQLLHLSRYIHWQSLQKLAFQGKYFDHQPSSYENFNGKEKTHWIYPEVILKFFSKNNPLHTYEAFVEKSDKRSFNSIYKLVIES